MKIKFEAENMDHIALGNAIQRAMSTIADPDKIDTEAKAAFTKALVSDSEIKRLFTMISMVAMTELISASNEYGLKEKMGEWDNLDDEEKKKYIHEFADKLKESDLAHMIEVSWLGFVTCGMLVVDKLPNHMLAQIGVDTGMEQRVRSALRSLDKGNGICESCGNLKHLMALGPGGTEVCHKCFEKDQSGATDAINGAMKKMFGPDSPEGFVVAAPRDLKGAELDAFIKTSIEEQMNTKAGKKEDITRFN